MTQAPLEFRDVTAANWSDLERLFETRGGPKHCWCMVWRRSSQEAKNQDGHFRKSLLKARLDGGEPIGILAYAESGPVAWCSVAPRGAHRPTMARVLPGDAQEVVWSLVCFYVRRDHRGEGVMRQLIEAAKARCLQAGATILEAYPVERDTPSYRFGGFTDVFADAGFAAAGEAGIRRKVYRLAFDRAVQPRQ